MHERLCECECVCTLDPCVSGQELPKDQAGLSLVTSGEQVLFLADQPTSLFICVLINVYPKLPSGWEAGDQNAGICPPEVTVGRKGQWNTISTCAFLADTTRLEVISESLRT